MHVSHTVVWNIYVENCIEFNQTGWSDSVPNKRPEMSPEFRQTDEHPNDEASLFYDQTQRCFIGNNDAIVLSNVTCLIRIFNGLSLVFHSNLWITFNCPSIGRFFPEINLYRALMWLLINPGSRTMKPTLLTRPINPSFVIPLFISWLPRKDCNFLFIKNS